MIKIFTKKRIIWGFVVLIILGGIGYWIFGNHSVGPTIQTAQVTRQTVKATVLSTGQVVSGTDLSLSFRGSGVIKSVMVKEGDKASINNNRPCGHYGRSGV